MSRALVVPLLVGACGFASFVSGTVLFFMGLTAADAAGGSGSGAWPLTLIGVGVALVIFALMVSGPFLMPGRGRGPKARSAGIESTWLK